MRKRTHRPTAKYRRIGVRLVTPIILASIVALGGAALSFYQVRKTPIPVSSAVQKVDTKKDALPSNLDGLLSATSIQDVATKAGGSAATDMTLENRSGVLVYAVTLSNGTTLGFNAKSGNAVVLSDVAASPQASRQSSQSAKDSLPSDYTVNTSFEEARRLAQDAFPNSTISQIQLNTSGNVVTLSVKFDDKSQVDINAANGSVIRVITPTGATAEAPSQTGSPSAATPTTTAPSANPSSKDSDDQGSSGANTSDTPNKTRTDTSKKGSADNTPVHAKGILTLTNGTYTVTDNNTAYAVQTDQDISSLVGKTVRVDGKLQTGDTIQATKIQLQQ